MSVIGKLCPNEPRDAARNCHSPFDPLHTDESEWSPVMSAGSKLCSNAPRDTTRPHAMPASGL